MTANLLLAELYRGEDPMLLKLRSQLREIARTPGLVTVLIEGAPGTGKTTMARALAMTRVLSMIDNQYHQWSVDRATKDVRVGAAFKWYRDISLAGLTDTLADTQLFGVGKGVATDVAGRIGIFEQAMTGCLDPKTAKTHSALVDEAKRNDRIPLATGGIVLLDEIGDLSPHLQGKLLRVLNGEMQYRVGAEGNPDFGFVFRGLVALATWKNIDAQGQLRDDLRQRICQHRVHVPGLADYPTEARIQIITSAAEVVRNEIRDELVHIDGLVGDEDDSQVLAPEWFDHANRSAGTRLTKPVLMKLADVEWAECGQLRGLRATLRRILCGADIDLALTETKGTFMRSNGPVASESAIDRLRRYLGTNSSFADGWMSDRHAWATEMLRLLDRDDPAALRIVSESGRVTSEIKKDLRNLARSGSNPSGN